MVGRTIDAMREHVDPRVGYYLQIYIFMRTVQAAASEGKTELLPSAGNDREVLYKHHLHVLISVTAWKTWTLHLSPAYQGSEAHMEKQSSMPHRQLSSFSDRSESYGNPDPFPLTHVGVSTLVFLDLRLPTRHYVFWKFRGLVREDTALACSKTSKIRPELKVIVRT